MSGDGLPEWAQWAQFGGLGLFSGAVLLWLRDFSSKMERLLMATHDKIDENRAETGRVREVLAVLLDRQRPEQRVSVDRRGVAE